MHSQELAKYIIVGDGQTVEDEVSEQAFFQTIKDCKNWIKNNEPERRFDIFCVDISYVEEVNAES